ncbi:MAG: glycosyltransferase family 39 protein, partial [Chloroflexi bacterium]|nr:glycosyltransferase family 39 protein [Chloroflexota bacterium]
YLLSLAALLIANLRHRIGSTLALACALFLVATPIVQFEATIAYADLPFAFYYVASAIYLYRFLTERKRAWLVVSSVLVGLAAWTRTEGPMYFAINLTVLLLFARPFKETAKQASTYAAIFVALWLPWTIWTRVANYGDYFGFAPIGVIDALAGRLDTARLGAIIGYLGQRVVALQDWGLLWIGLIVALVIALRDWRLQAPLVTLIVLNVLAVIYTYYVATAQSSFDVNWWLTTGFDRITLHWIPLSAFFLGQAIGAKTRASRSEVGNSS